MQQNKMVKWALIVRQRFLEAEVSQTAVIMAYYLLLSLFPMLIALGNLLPLFNVRPEVIMPYIYLVVPDAVEPVLDPIITSLLTSGSGGLLSISAVGVLWSAGRGVSFLRRGMNKAYGVRSDATYFLKRAASMLMVMLLLVLLGVFTLVFSVGQRLVHQLGDIFPWLVTVNQYLRDLRWPVIVLLLWIMLMIIYRILPSVQLRHRHVWPGAVLATIGLLMLTQLFTIYMQFASNSFNSYGALGAFLVLMFWLHFCCIILLLGAVLNASLTELRHGKAQPQANGIDTFVISKAELWIKRRQAGRAAKKGLRRLNKTEQAQLPQNDETENGK